jgi:hypothetical protein
MILPFSPVYVLVTGFILILVVFGFITRQNAILTKENKHFGYVAYNHSRNSSEADKVIAFWQQDVLCVNAVKNIIYLDYLFMFLYGFTILYGLLVPYYNSNGAWKIVFGIGIAFITTGVLVDAIQDYAIYERLVKNKYNDLRYLTTFKFSLIAGAIIILISSFFK